MVAGFYPFWRMVAIRKGLEKVGILDSEGILLRKALILVGLIFVAAVAGILLIQDKQTETDITANTTRVGLILNGSHEDHNYVQSHFEALQSLRQELNLKIIYREKVPNDCYDVIKELIQKEDCEIIVAISFGFGDDLKRAAAEYPQIYFLHAAGTGVATNLSSFFGRMYQARYLAAFPIPEVIRGINAFALGARSVRPDAKVYVRYCNSWTADEPAADACEKLLDAHPIDTVILHTNSIMPHKITESKGVKSIGCNKDNRDLFTSTYLTASEWNWQVYYRQQILNCLRGKFHGKHTWMGMEDGITKLSDFSNLVKKETKDAVAAANFRLTSREFDVFYGPIRDNQGNLRVEAGESMSDDAMLNTFDWYVEGISVEQ